MKKISFYIDNNNFAYDTDYIKENSKSIYSEGMYGDEYRIEKNTNKVFKNQKYIGTAQTVEII